MLSSDRRTTVGSLVQDIEDAHQRTLVAQQGEHEEAGTAFAEDVKAVVEVFSTPQSLTEKFFQLATFLWTSMLLVATLVGSRYVFEEVQTIDDDGTVHEVDMMAMLAVVYAATQALVWVVGLHAYGPSLIPVLSKKEIWLHNIPYAGGLLSAFSLLQANSYLDAAMVAVLTRPRMLVDALLGYMVLNQQFTSTKTLLLLLVLITAIFHALAKQEAVSNGEAANDWMGGFLFVGLSYVAPIFNAYTAWAQKNYDLPILPSTIVYSFIRCIAATAIALARGGTASFSCLSNPTMLAYMVVYTVYDLNYFIVLPIIQPIGISLAGALGVAFTYGAEMLVFGKEWDLGQGMTAVQTGLLIMTYVLYDNNHLKKAAAPDPTDDVRKSLLAADDDV